MNPFLLMLLSTCLLLQPTTQPAADVAPDDASVKLANKIVEASGGDVWPTVKRIRFTFNVESDGELRLSARHDWDVTTGVDTVTIGDRTISCNVYETGERDIDQTEAFKRWTNDSYWLLMPLKLRDPGVKFSPLVSSRDMPPSRGRMTMSFEGVGLTPNDQYDLSIDLRNNRIDHWVYRPNEERASGFTWENYQDFNGLILATERKSDDGQRRIFFTDIEVMR